MTSDRHASPQDESLKGQWLGAVVAASSHGWVLCNILARWPIDQAVIFVVLAAVNNVG